MFVLCLSLVTWLFTQHINKEKQNYYYYYYYSNSHKIAVLCRRWVSLFLFYEFRTSLLTQNLFILL